MCEFVVNSFPFEIIMMGTAARRAGEPFVQQFLDKHSRAVLAFHSPLRLIPSPRHANTIRIFPGGRRLCLRRPPRYALFLRRATPTRSHFSRADAAFVGVPISATPCFSIGPRQHDRKFPGRTSPSPLRLIPPSGHANAVPLFPGGRRLCWRPHLRYALFLHRTTPTRPEISRADAAFVCAALPAAPYFFASPRQHDRKFPGRTPPLLASPSPLRLVSSPRHANTTGNFPGGRRLCWRRPTRCALSLRRVTPTRSHFSLTCWRIWVLENKKPSPRQTRGF